MLSVAITLQIASDYMGLGVCRTLSFLVEMIKEKKKVKAVTLFPWFVCLDKFFLNSRVQILNPSFKWKFTKRSCLIMVDRCGKNNDLQLINSDSFSKISAIYRNSIQDPNILLQLGKFLSFLIKVVIEKQQCKGQSS